MGTQHDEIERIDKDQPGSWTPRRSPTFQNLDQRAAYQGLIDGLDANRWAFKRTERGKRLLPESSIRNSVLSVFDEYLSLYEPDDWDSFPSDVHRELIEWRKREVMMAHRWEAAKARCKRLGSWLLFGWLLVLVLMVTSINEIFSAARQREAGLVWAARISDRMTEDGQVELAARLDEYMQERW